MKHYGKQNNSHVQSSGTCMLITWQVNLQIKLRLPISSPWAGEGILNCPGGCPVTTRAFCKCKREVGSGSEAETCLKILHCWLWRRNRAKNQGMWAASRSWKRQKENKQREAKNNKQNPKQILSCSLQKGIQTALPIWIQWDPFWISDP